MLRTQPSRSDTSRAVQSSEPPQVQRKKGRRMSPSSPSPKLPTPAPMKKVTHRSSKPIINWFQRKLSGTAKTKRVDNLPVTLTDFGRPTNRGGRIVSSPLPVPALVIPRQQGKLDTTSQIVRRKTISLDEDEPVRESGQSYDDDNSVDRSSFARDSIWSPTSAVEADEDASVRPIPPSAPPSPSPSRSSSSYLSYPRTFRSMAASTKPTTLLSIDMNGNGMAHIAQAPPTPTSQVHRFVPHVRQSSSLSNPGLLSSGGSITFSALPQSSSRPSSLLNPINLSPSSGNSQGHQINGLLPVQAPLHTTHHPRNNPRPSSPPLDNASVLTLASSAYASPVRASTQGYFPSIGIGAGDSVSHYGGSTYADMESSSQFVPGDDDRLEERDVDASVRALRPRSSRRGSWESEASRWSARIQFGTGAPSLARERSLWTTNSARTGGVSTDNGEAYDRADEAQYDDEKDGQDESFNHENLAFTSFSESSDTEGSRKSDIASHEVDDQHNEDIEIAIPRQLSTDTVAQITPVPHFRTSTPVMEDNSQTVINSAKEKDDS